MRKLFIAILLFMMLPDFVLSKSQVYYSSYGPYSEYGTVKLETSDLQKVERERRYQYYREERIDGPYEVLGENMKEYPLIDIHRKKKSEFSGWQKEKPAEKPNRVIEQKRKYRYQQLDPILFITLHDFISDQGLFYIDDLKIFHQGKELKYQMYTCGGCTGRFGTGLSVMKDQEITVTLPDLYYLDQLEFVITMKQEYEQSFQISVGRYSYHYDTTNTLGKIFATKQRFEQEKRYTSRDVVLLHPSWEPTILEGDIDESDVTKLILEKNDSYRYQDTLFQYYQLKPIIDPIFHKEAPAEFPVRGSEYLDYYRSSRRDKVILASQMKLSSKEQKIEDFILYHSLPVTIEGTVNLKKNASYPVMFDLQFQKVEKTIVVDLLENDKQELKQLENKMKQSQVVISQLENKIKQETDARRRKNYQQEKQKISKAMQKQSVRKAQLVHKIKQRELLSYSDKMIHFFQENSRTFFIICIILLVLLGVIYNTKKWGKNVG